MSSGSVSQMKRFRLRPEKLCVSGWMRTSRLSWWAPSICRRWSWRSSLQTTSRTQPPMVTCPSTINHLKCVLVKGFVSLGPSDQEGSGLWSGPRLLKSSKFRTRAGVQLIIGQIRNLKLIRKLSVCRSRFVSEKGGGWGQTWRVLIRALSSFPGSDENVLDFWCKH